MQYCPHCMKPVTGGGRCPNCGGDVSWTGQQGIDLPVGTILNGGNGLRTYQIGAARGKGGFGITYIALETNSGRRMAIKEYFPTRCAFRGGNGVDVQAMTGQEEPFQSGMKSFLEEGKMLLSQDDLSCVVHVIDYFQANGTAYLVMEYLDGVALHTQMNRMGGRIPVSELMPRLAPLLRDIGQLHQRGVIHRDISPDNIMWMPDGGLKLLDFGSARSMENGKSMTVLMKQGFSPIEQYRSKGQGPYTDIYALAATIYYCITGVIPPASMERLAEDTLQSPIALGAALTVQQETALLWALSIQPNGRPQSMEEFSAMLYKEEKPSLGYPIQPEQPPKIQPQPVTEQNNSYPYNQVYPGQPSGPAQYPSQPSGPAQYPGQPSNPAQYPGQPPNPAQYPGQPSNPAQYPGQPAGPVQYPGQPVDPGQNRSGGGGNKKLPILIGAAAVIVVAAGLITAWFFGPWRETVDTPSPSGNPSQSVAAMTSDIPTLSLPPEASGVSSPSLRPETPSLPPSENPNVGTVDGFRYEIVNGDHVAITGYQAGANFSYMPDDVDGLPITEIAAGAFAGAGTGGFINLPMYLRTIGANAFRDCTDLSHVYAYSDITVDSTSFSGCSNMWFVAVQEPNVSTSGWKLPSGVSLYYCGMETGAGILNDMTRNGNLLVGETDSDFTVLLDVRSGTETVTGLDEVGWICSWALDRLSYGAAIELGSNTVYPFSVFSGSFSWSAPDSTLADMWMLSCATAREINAVRPSGATQMVPDLELLYAAVLRAEEYAQLRDISTRPDGSRWSSILDELGVSRSWTAAAAGSKTEYADAWNRAAEYLTETYTSALTQEDSATYAGQYYSRLGVAVSQEYGGQYVWWGFVTIP